MDIPQPKDEDSQNSNKDALFQYHPNQTLIKKIVKHQSAYRLTYKKSFETIIANRLLKKTLNTSWAQRYFILTSTRILYYGDSSMKQLKGCFNLASLIEYNLQIKSNYPQIIFIVEINNQQEEGVKTLLQLMIEDKYLFQDWERQLKRVMANLLLLKAEDLSLFPKIKKESILQTISKIGKSGNFWNNVTISFQELSKYASHLDIILLRSKNPIFYLHRFFMRSYYDHVGILIKDQTEKIFVFQAIQSKGVCISSLQSLIATFTDEYQELGYRKLLIENNANFHIQQLQDYINSLLGSKYELSISKILIDNETVKPNQALSGEQNQQKQSKQQRTYFCSQLIADLYLRFGILSEGKSNNYWPKDFQENEIVLSKGFKFSPVMRVQLEHEQHSDKSQN